MADLKMDTPAKVAREQTGNAQPFPPASRNSGSTGSLNFNLKVLSLPTVFPL
jgi:hypothetical protein